MSPETEDPPHNMTQIPFHADLGHGITLLDSGYTGSEVAAVYLLVEKGKCAIIETGTSHSVPGILAVLGELGLKTTDVEYVMPTHVHLDHAGGAGELMRVCTSARLIVHPFGARHLIDPTKLIAGATAVYGEAQFDSLYGKLEPVDAARVIEANDGFELDFQGRRLLLLDTPGHARHHYCIHDSRSKGIYTGDTFGLAYPKLVTPSGPFLFATTTPVQFDPQAMLHSIDRLLSFHPEQLYLTHFGPVQPKKESIDELKNSIEAFVDIALEEAQKTNRVQRIEERIMDYLLDRLTQLGCQLELSGIRQLLQMDCQLNAQGLDVWLSRQQKG